MRGKPYLLTAPLAALLLILIIGLGHALIQSFGYIPALGLNEFSFKYYQAVFANPDFRRSLLLSLSISMWSSLLSLAAGILICTGLVYFKGKTVLIRYLIRVPVLVPHTVVAFLTVLLCSQSGILSRLLFAAGLINEPAQFPNLLYDAGGAGIILAYVWKQAPFVAYFILALMESISTTWEEAAVNLGASRIRAFFTITLPLTMPAVLKAWLIIAVFSFGSYELPFLLGATKPKALPVQAYLEYMHPDLQHRPYAMAMNGVMIAASLATAVVYFLLLSRRTDRMRRDYEE